MSRSDHPCDNTCGCPRTQDPPKNERDRGPPGPPLVTMLVGLVLLVLVAMLYGCRYDVTQYGPTLTEEAKVVDLAYVPAGHGSSSSVGYSTSGDVTFGGGSVDIPARYAIVFECSHGRFVVEGEQHAALWRRLREGQTVSVRYREVQRCESEDGDPLPNTCRTYDLDFLDALPRGPE